MLVFLDRMKQKTLILFDLKEKSNAQRSRILQKLYGYRDISNYSYSYQREGLLSEIPLEKSKKVVLDIKNIQDVAKVAEILKNLKVEFEVAKIQ